jgi:hypothetical protein
MIFTVMNPTFLPLVAMLSSLVLAACSGPSDGPPEPSPSTAPAAAVAAAPRQLPTACELVTAAEMSALLGSTVSAGPNDRSSGKTECIYSPTTGISPYVELAVEWGEGQAAMEAAGAMQQHEPGIADPYEGVGDQAVAVGTTLMIRRGEDLVTIVLSGIDDAPATAKKIFDSVDSRL